MSRFVITVLLLFTMCLPLSVCTAEVITVDPNTSAVKTAEGIAPDGDPRLAQKVTYQAQRKTVLAILTDLSSQTGVTLKAGYNDEDWQVRDRRMNIFVKDLPLSNLMNSIARVMRFKWSKSEADGVVSYKLYLDRDTLLGAERKRYLEEEKLRKQQIEARQTFMTGLEEAAEMSEGELEQLKTQSPYVYAMAKIGWAGVLAGVFEEVPAARQAWLEGRMLTVDMASLSPVTQQNIAKLQHGIDQEMLDKGVIAIHNDENFPGNRAYPYIGIGNATIKFDGPCYETDFQYPDSDEAKAWVKLSTARGLFDPVERADKSVIDQLRDEWSKTIVRDNKDLSEPLTEHPDDPALTAKVKMRVEGDSFADTLSALAKSSGFAVVSDSFYRRAGNSEHSAEETQVRKVLDEIESTYWYNWERHGSILELHDRNWFRKRAAQLPDAWLEPLRKSFQANGSLDINELSQIAALTDEQYGVNVRQDDILYSKKLDNVILGCESLLRLYSRLDKQQRTLVFNKQGLRLESLRKDQLPSLQALLKESHFQEDSQKGLRLLGTAEKQGKQNKYDFRFVSSSGDATGMQWSIESPEYTPPSPEKPKGARSE